MGNVANAQDECTAPSKIKSLYPRDGGWVAVEVEGLANADISSCGNSGPSGLLLNYNDTTGSLQGKRMVYSILLLARINGASLVLCSDGCDTQHPSYSRLSHIDRF